jgi:hypothetical protein
VRWNAPDPEVEMLAVSMLLASIFVFILPVIAMAWFFNRIKPKSAKQIERRKFREGDLVRVKEVKDPMFKTRWDGKVGVITRKWDEMDLYLVTFTDNVSGKNFASFKWFDLESLYDE